MATLRGKNRKRSNKMRFADYRRSSLVTFVAVLILAAVGSYLVFISRADTPYEYDGIGGSLEFYIGGNLNNTSRLGPYKDGTISIDIGRDDEVSLPEFQILVIYTYNINVFQGPVSVTCKWQYGCHQSEWNGPRHSTANDARIVTCHTVPAGFRVKNAPLVNFKTRLQDRVFDEEAIDNVYIGWTKGSCQSNPTAVGAKFAFGGFDGCNSVETGWTEYVCGPKGGSIPIYNGFTPIRTGTGTGNGGEGTGNNGNGTGSGPGPGAGGGGGGSSANRQADKPNSLPKPSAQGENKQTELEPDPFFDGKEYEKGSDTDNLVFGNSSIGGKKVPKIMLYILSALLLGGAGGALYWRWKKGR